MSRNQYRFCAILALLILLSHPSSIIRAKEPLGVLFSIWSPDGQRIAFVVYGQKQYALYVIGKRGSNLAKLTDNGDAPDWSPDGKQIAYTELSPNRNKIYTINADGSNRTEIAEGVTPIWSPNGRQIVYTSVYQQTLSRPLYVVNADGSSRTEIAEGYAPIWSPDGGQIAYFSANGLYVVNADGTNAHCLYCIPQHILSFKWSPDSTRIAIAVASTPRADIDTRWRLAVLDRDGSHLTMLVGNVTNEMFWSPDGHHILYSGTCGSPMVTGICVADTNTS